VVKLGKTSADLEATPRAVSWRAIRSLRADPPGRAGGARQATFVMALEQAEELFTAAAATGPAARALPLFYGLSQAGRALFATRTPGDLWKPRGHGIGEGSGNSTGIAVADFEVEPRPGRAGAFALVAEALASSALPGPTRLGDLWPLLPDTQRFALPSSGPHRILNIQVNTYRSNDDPINAEISGLPADLGIQRGPDDDPSAPRADWAEEEQRVREFLAHYPSLNGLKFGGGGGQPIGFRPMDDGTALVAVQWPNDPENACTPEELSKRVATSYVGHANAYPCLDTSGRPIHPLVVWWATLFGLSILARYEPETWGRAIDINTSHEAVAIEHILNAALDSVPELLYRVLTDDA
jgi:hypothetical protein